MPKKLSAFKEYKERQQPICMLTCYSFPTAQIVEAAGVDIALVGDSLGTTFLGYASTKDVTLDDMRYHVAAVKRGCAHTYTIADMPYQTYTNKEQALSNALLLIDAGADGIKLEGAETEVIAYLCEKEIDVCGHIGYLPQTAEAPKVVGKEIEAARQALADAKAVEAAGADMIVFELMPKELSAYISEQLSIPSIGIGAGQGCDGQVQVLDDLLGLSERTFKHARPYARHRSNAIAGIRQYCEDVRDKTFPTDENASHVDDAFIEELKNT